MIKCLYQFVSKMGMSRKLVISQRNPLHTVIFVVVLAMAMTLSIWTYFDRSQWLYISSNLSKVQQGNALWQENKAMQSEVGKLKEHVGGLESTIQLEKQTITNLQQEMIEQQERIYALNNELLFYQGVMQSIDLSGGLNIQGLRIEETSQPRHYRFQVILTHVSKGSKTMSGRLSISLEGLQAGVARTLDIEKLPLSESLSLNFKFDSFQRVVGGIILPQDFVVHNVIVQAYREKNKKTADIKRIFDWLKVLQS